MNRKNEAYANASILLNTKLSIYIIYNYMNYENTIATNFV